MSKLSVPKYVEITNTRLNILFYFLTGMMLFLNVYMFIHFKQYTEKINAGSRLSTRFAANQTLWVEHAAAASDQQGFGTCGPGAGGPCLPICGTAGVMLGACMPLEMTQEEPTSTNAFVVTSVADTSGQAESLVDDGLGLALGETYFTPTAEDLSLIFSYSYQLVEKPGWFPLGVNDDISQGSSAENTITVVVDSRGDLWKQVPPGQDIALTVGELLALASDLPPEFRQMDEDGSPPDLVAVFREGLELAVGTDCYSDSDDLATYIGGPLQLEATRHSPVCVMRVGFADRRALRREHVGGGRLRTMHGVRVICSDGNGFFRLPSLNSIYLNLTTAIVLVGMPRVIMLLFMIYCLGHVSTIYRKVIIEEFDILDEVGGVVTRLMASCVAFHNLADVEDDDEEGTAVSRNRMAQRIREIFKHQSAELSPQELDRLIHFCYSQVVENRKSKRHLLSDMASEALHAVGVSKRNMGSVAKERRVDITNFSTACTSHDSLSFGGIVKLFDKDRRASYMETFFTPRILYHYIHDLHRAESGYLDCEPTETKATDTGMLIPEAGALRILSQPTSASLATSPTGALRMIAMPTGASTIQGPGSEMSLPKMSRVVTELARRDQLREKTLGDLTSSLQRLELDCKGLAQMDAEVRRAAEQRCSSLEALMRGELRGAILEDFKSMLRELRLGDPGSGPQGTDSFATAGAKKALRPEGYLFAGCAVNRAKPWEGAAENPLHQASVAAPIPP